MTDKSTNSDHLAQGQQSIPTATAIGMNAVKPMLHFHISMLRMWADNLERLAGKYEQAVDETVTTLAVQSEKERAA